MPLSISGVTSPRTLAVVAETNEEARKLALPQKLTTARLRSGGQIVPQRTGGGHGELCVDGPRTDGVRHQPGFDVRRHTGEGSRGVCWPCQATRHGRSDGQPESSLSEAFGLDISIVHRQLAAAIKHRLVEKV